MFETLDVFLTLLMWLRRMWNEEVRFEEFHYS